MIFDKFIKSVKDNIDSLSNKPDNNGVKQQVPSSIDGHIPRPCHQSGGQACVKGTWSTLHSWCLTPLRNCYEN